MNIQGIQEIQDEKLLAIADAIRTKEESTAEIPSEEFAQRILALKTGGLTGEIYTVSLMPNSAESGTVPQGGFVSEGVILTVTAEPAEGYTFIGWQEDGEIVSWDPSYTFTVLGNRILTANFKMFLDINVVVDPDGRGTVVGGGTYEKGELVTVSYTPDEGCVFKGWYDGETLVSDQQIYIFAAAKNMNLTAKVEVYCSVTAENVAVGGPHDGETLTGVSVTGLGNYPLGAEVTVIIPRKIDQGEGRDYNYPEIAWTGNQPGSGECIDEYWKYTWTITENTKIEIRYKYSWLLYIEPSNPDTIEVNNFINPSKIYQINTVSASNTFILKQGFRYESYAVEGTAGRFEVGATTMEDGRVSIGYFCENPQSDISVTITTGKASRLPVGYTEVAWIQASTVASYIDTKKGVNNSDFIVKFQIPEVSGFYTASASSFAVYSSKFRIFKNGNSSTFLMRLISSSSTSYSGYTLADNLIKDALGKEFIIAINGKSVTINGESQTASSYNIYGNNLMVGSTNPSGTIRVKFKYMKGSRTSVTSSTYNFELIPCINPIGTVGLYDITNNEFIGPTAGSFTAGPAV